MKLTGILTTLAAAALFSLVFANTYLPYFGQFKTQGRYVFEVKLTSTAPGTAQLFYDAGRGFSEADSARVPLSTGQLETLTFPLPTNSIRGLRFDPINTAGSLTVRDAVIRRPDGSVLRKFDPAAFSPVNQVASLRIEGPVLHLEVEPGTNDPVLYIDVGTAFLPLNVPWSGLLLPFVRRALPVFLVLAGLLAAWRQWGGAWQPRLAALAVNTRQWIVARPRSALAVTSALAVVISSYPVIFCGASIVSPNYGTPLLYDGYPTLPRSKATAITDVHGADIGAIMWQHVPLSVIQSRALLRDGELPLWNRYNSGGTALLGQGQSIFGDPLHFGVLLAGGATWAWDLKYLAAKWLLGLTLGLIVLHTARHLPAALLVAFASIFVGFFLYRVNHPAFFSFCYGPLVLYAWCHVVDAASRRQLYFALLGLIGACWMLMVSGTAKEAYVSLFTMNFAGVLLLVCSAHSWRERLRRTGWALAAGGVFLLAAAPVWLTFMDAIKASYSSYNAASAFQLQPGLAIGFFDEILLRPFWENEHVFNPSSNFLLLLGVLAYLVNLRALAANGYALGIGLGALFPVAFIFGLVPPRWIAGMPFLGNIHHIDNSFGVGLIHLFAVMAGFGFAQAAGRLGRREGRGDLALATLLIGALLLHYFGLTQVVQRSTYTALLWGQSVPRSYFVWGSLVTLLAAGAGLALAAHHALARQRVTLAAGLVLAACGMTLLWRHGLHWRTQFPDHTLLAAPRADFLAPSPALQALRADMKEPARVVGLQGSFFPGWTGVYDLEGVNGPDALVNPSMRELQTAMGIERIWDWRLMFTPDNLPAARPFLNLLNARYLLDDHTESAKLAGQLTPVASADLAVYRNDSAWPRAFFTNRVATYGTAADFAGLVRREGGRPLAAVQSGDRNLPALPVDDPADRTVTPAAQYRLTNNTTSFDVTTSGPGVIVLAEPWLKGDFRVTVNGRRVEYFRVNHAFKGIKVDAAGHYRVTVRYLPRNFLLALALCAAGFATAGAGWWWVRRHPGAAASS